MGSGNTRVTVTDALRFCVRHAQLLAQLPGWPTENAARTTRISAAGAAPDLARSCVHDERGPHLQQSGFTVSTAIRQDGSIPGARAVARRLWLLFALAPLVAAAGLLAGVFAVAWY